MITFSVLWLVFIIFDLWCWYRSKDPENPRGFTAACIPGSGIYYLIKRRARLW